ncbi:hypothetical protein FPOAC1_001052 [Fusarium poae]|uniref:hypothetical protein n=1 Tax=Fusarium poae TaxID=36050 RepID=UPI001CE739A1|nr:hypothetical protein FPOAC1_001052 [Fusarium poae]KAG8675075.1 hypothetical protein FPOAC1_001052 [Fusarium poae]
MNLPVPRTHCKLFTLKRSSCKRRLGYIMLENVLNEFAFDIECIEKELSSLGLKWHSFDDLFQALSSKAITEHDRYAMWADTLAPPKTPTIKEVGVEAGVFKSAPNSSPTGKRTAEDDNSPSPKRAKTQKADKKVPETSDPEQHKPQIAYCMPSVTESSGVKILWKGATGNYLSFKDIVFTQSKTRVEIQHEAMKRHGAFQVEAYAVRNRTYITYIARKRIQHLLDIDRPSDFLVFAMEFQPLHILRPILARDIKARDIAKNMIFLQQIKPSSEQS